MGLRGEGRRIRSPSYLGVHSLLSTLTYMPMRRRSPFGAPQPALSRPTCLPMRRRSPSPFRLLSSVIVPSFRINGLAGGRAYEEKVAI